MPEGMASGQKHVSRKRSSTSPFHRGQEIPRHFNKQIFTFPSLRASKVPLWCAVCGGSSLGCPPSPELRAPPWQRKGLSPHALGTPLRRQNRGQSCPRPRGMHTLWRSPPWCLPTFPTTLQLLKPGTQTLPLTTASPAYSSHKIHSLGMWPAAQTCLRGALWGPKVGITSWRTGTQRRL